MEASITGSFMYTSPFRIFRLKEQPGLVQTHALYITAAPWPPKSDRGTSSPSPHLRHTGNVVGSIWSLIPSAQPLLESYQVVPGAGLSKRRTTNWKGPQPTYARRLAPALT